MIRLGDYKLIEHLRTGEQKLFNVVTDYREKHNLIDTDTTKAKELKTVLSQYLQSIDAEDIQDVYQARFAELDRFEAQARSVHAQALQRANGDSARITEANKKLAKDLARFAKNRQECRTNMARTRF